MEASPSSSTSNGRLATKTVVCGSVKSSLESGHTYGARLASGLLSWLTGLLLLLRLSFDGSSGLLDLSRTVDTRFASLARFVVLPLGLGSLLGSDTDSGNVGSVRVLGSLSLGLLVILTRDSSTGSLLLGERYFKECRPISPSPCASSSAWRRRPRPPQQRPRSPSLPRPSQQPWRPCLPCVSRQEQRDARFAPRAIERVGA